MPDPMVPSRRLFLLDREVIQVTGPESAGYLQGQLSQDVVALADGGFAWSWLLAPNGKVDALLRVARISADEWWLDVDAGWGEPVRERLNRFKLRTRAEVGSTDRRVVALRGEGWGSPPGSFVTGLVLGPPWPGVEGADVICSAGAALELATGTGDGPAAEAAEAYEPERIAAGIPRMGLEMDERTIPGETGLVPWTVSFTKGCYTGQELVARIDSRGGNVPRHLRKFRLAGDPSGGGPAAGAELFVGDGSPAGRLTSAGTTLGGEWAGLGYVRRGVDPAVTLVAGEGGPLLTQSEAVP